jgi:hypothetical protein
VGRSGHSTLPDENQTCKGRQNQAILMIENSVLSRIYSIMIIFIDVSIQNQ